MTLTEEYDNTTAELFAILYAEDLNKYYILTAPNKFQEWKPGEPLIQFSTETLNGDTITFPIITDSLDLTNLSGTFDFYYGFKLDNSSLIYTTDKLIF